MNTVKNENGHGMVYILWIMVMSIVIFVIVVNIGKVYAVKQQAATATQQAALAGTSVLVEATVKGVEAFDRSEVEEVEKQRKADDGKSVSELIDEEAEKNRQRGEAKDIAYIHALNDVLPSRITDYESLKMSISRHINGAIDHFKQVVREVIEDNGGNIERSTVTFSLDYRVEVQADATYEAITDHAENYMPKMSKEIPQKGSGPSLRYLQGIVGGFD
ncbi:MULTISPECIES: pilus assembly protein TadG-related protein [Sporosarcina]|uniref:Pilus assembly protein TadG-related protein n=1 Tax=Sporosarcina contaminans TaxID=633403 RepID=A0ABW3TZX8_9BACL